MRVLVETAIARGSRSMWVLLLREQRLWGLSLVSVPGPEEDFLKDTPSITHATADT